MLQETVTGQAIERKADHYFTKYKPFVEALERNSLLSKVRAINTTDVYALGKQLENFQVYKRLCEEDGTLSQLGKIPDVALDVLTVAYGTSPLSAIASIQPIDEEQGTIYFKNIVSGDSQLNSGDLLSGVSATSNVMGEALGQTQAGESDYSFSLKNAPVQVGSVRVEIAELNLVAQDNGLGQLIGFDIQGTIDYVNGTVTLSTKHAPEAEHTITAAYSGDYDAADDIPKVGMKFASKTVQARLWALKDTIGLQQSYALRRRFGMVAEDEIAQDLVAAINSEQMNTATRMLLAKAQGEVTFKKNAPSGISYNDHKQGFKDAIAQAEATILNNAGRGTISAMVAGRNVCALAATLPGFTKLSDGAAVGPHIFGILDGILIVRVPNQQVMDADTAVCVYKGKSNFESALVSAPYMPLVVTSALPHGVNPLVNQRAAAVWSAIDVLVPSFITKIRLV
ncbi:hypothetical protein HUZ36_14295 [Pseudoalteromonas sp. McH1-7]|uniref:Uncharacterized protein n=1 Tax=Pseudoalteromonas peptidolytica F12-50-A1 TaxID=1315280 RepID=A0A8I0MZN2_9GAMM|nr:MULTISPECIES: hypothetical protein [Pseudoalteromonas]MBE0347909.1 hypothetical protein [Pseudoalteromonas peptidolytica F12-50-A1]MDW7551340.1 hypothetical protein [Pseudoalteromonas peptidolytica]NLR15294.1 hypothetical protein [Pseudoalteromonas peptidolytica]NUZ11955.1 hypothetical protein [Pseudoalteromonas sp. McH1-7]USD31156.1 hypothetical protein J8Z24_21310 [Pseudoalteromonas sp. SCSIO 43201]